MWFNITYPNFFLNWFQGHTIFNEGVMQLGSQVIFCRILFYKSLNTTSSKSHNSLIKTWKTLKFESYVLNILNFHLQLVASQYHSRIKNYKGSKLLTYKTKPNFYCLIHLTLKIHIFKTTTLTILNFYEIKVLGPKFHLKLVPFQNLNCRISNRGIKLLLR